MLIRAAALHWLWQSVVECKGPGQGSESAAGPGEGTARYSHWTACKGGGIGGLGLARNKCLFWVTAREVTSAHWRAHNGKGGRRDPHPTLLKGAAW